MPTFTEKKEHVGAKFTIKTLFEDRKLSKRGQMLHCATVEIPHCAGSCAANPIGLLSVFGTLRNYCLVPLLAYAFTRERLIHNSGLTGGDP